jgi:hypothetical protein
VEHRDPGERRRLCLFKLITRLMIDPEKKDNKLTSLCKDGISLVFSISASCFADY